MLNKIHRFFFNLFFKTFYINQQTGDIKDKDGIIQGNIKLKSFEQYYNETYGGQE